MLFSQLYWRYPFVPPPLLAELREIKSIEQLSSVAVLGPESVPHLTVTAQSGVPQVQFSWLETTDRMLQPLRTQSLQIRSSEPLSRELVTSIWNAADKSGLLISGDPGYQETKALDGHIGIVRLADGSKVAIASLIGREHSNDHYPYYEFVLSLDKNEPKVMNSQWFFVDIAGIEEMNWLSFAVMSFIVMAPLVIALEIAWAFFSAYRRRRVRTNPIGS